MEEAREGIRFWIFSFTFWYVYTFHYKSLIKNFTFYMTSFFSDITFFHLKTKNINMERYCHVTFQAKTRSTIDSMQQPLSRDHEVENQNHASCLQEPEALMSVMEVTPSTAPQSAVCMFCSQIFLQKLQIYPLFCPKDAPLLCEFIFKSS